MRYLYAVLLTVLFFSSCSKSTDSANEPTSGDINGTIQVWDDKLNSLADRSGVTVTLEKADGDLIATTNTNGRYEFKNVPFGEYDLVISKSNYGTMQLFDIRHAKTTTGTATSTTTTVPSFSFGQKSTTQITNLSVVSTIFSGGPGVTFGYTLSPAPTSSNNGYVRFFFGNSVAVTANNYVAFSEVRGISNNGGNVGFSKDDLIRFGFKAGQTIFVKLYGESVVSNAYFDANTGRTVFPNLNEVSPAAVSFVLP